MRLLRHLFVRDYRFFGARKIRHQMTKEVCLAGERALLREAIQRLPQKQGCPFTIVDFLRLPFRCSRNLRLRLCGSLIVQGRKDHAAAAFQGSSTIVHIGGEMFQCAEEKRTEPSLLAVGPRVCTRLDQVSEKALDQISRILWAASLAA